jgi:hypothetical protein
MQSVWLCLPALAMLALADAGATAPAGADQFKSEKYRALTAEIVLPYMEKTYAKPVAVPSKVTPTRKVVEPELPPKFPLRVRGCPRTTGNRGGA